MKQLNKAKGTLGEREAVKFLKKHKYKILDTNYTCPIGEIDVVALESGFLVIIEVKTRESAFFGRPCEAVDEVKQRKLCNLALVYQKAMGLADMPLRFDVVEVLENEINLIKNAF